ncbi:MAG TPA: sulfotransferase, partial [Bryobacteraceae bacterium]
MSEMRPPRLPNFFLVGAGKAGTTSLHGYLQQHPEIYMSPVKEPCYFADEVRPANLDRPIQNHVRRQTRHLPGLLDDGEPVKPLGWLACDWDDYLRLFRGVNHQKAIGEASAVYLWSPSAPGNIRTRIPHARIVMILRDPTERAFSQYLHQLSVGLTQASFREHIQRCIRNGNSSLGIYHPFLEVGLYYEQVKRYLAEFPRQNIRIYWYEEAWRQPAFLLVDIFDFLEVDSTFRPDLSSRVLERRAPRLTGLHYLLKRSNIWEPLKSFVPQSLRPRLSSMAFQRGRTIVIDPRDRQFLVGYYRDDIRKLESLLNRD